MNKVNNTQLPILFSVEGSGGQTEIVVVQLCILHVSIQAKVFKIS